MKETLQKINILKKRLNAINTVLKSLYGKSRHYDEEEDVAVSVRRPDAHTPQSELPHYGFKKQEMEKYGPAVTAAAGGINGIFRKDDEDHTGMYHITEGGQQLTDEPVTLDYVQRRFGGTQRLESKGYRLIPFKPPKK